MLCREIHDDPNGCSQEIPGGSGWKFCPLCGRLTGHIRSLQASERSVALPYHQTQSRQLSLRSTGETPVAVHLALDTSVSGVQLNINQNANLAVSSRRPQQIEIDFPPLTQSGGVGYLLIEAEDAKLDPLADPWQERRPRVIRAELLAEIQTPAQVQVIQQIALFRQGVSERTVTLRNLGNAPAEVIQVQDPPGYRVAPHEGVVSGLSRLDFTVTRQWGQTVPITSLLTFKMGDGAVHQTLLHCPPTDPARELSDAILGIDFGTAFTSIAFRECKHHPRVDDDVRFLRPLGESADRFPTRLWVSKANPREFEFGSRATQKYKEDLTDGFLFREIKTLLRDPKAAFVHPESFKDEAVRMMQDRHGKNWSQTLVTEYLSRLYHSVIAPELKLCFGSTDVIARYVFSLPVLDYATDQRLYNEQHDKMAQCIERAGFPMERVEFQFEPVCASLGLLYPPAGKQWPSLSSREYLIKDGDAIAVFDSGGGTTDVALAKAEVGGEGGRVRLRIEKCLGVDSKAETFGGEAVTDSLLEALKDPRSVKSQQQWYQGDIDVDTILPDARGDDLKQHDEAEKLKTELAGNRPITRGNTVIQPIILEKLVISHLASLAQELVERVFTETSREQTQYYLCVGGNTYLPIVERWVELFMKDEAPDHNKRRLRIPNEDRKVAVSYGAAWVPDARIRNAVPYDVEVKAGTHCLLPFKRNTSQELYDLRRSYSLPAAGSMEFRIEATLEERPYLLESAILTNPYEDAAVLEARADVQNGVIRVEISLRNPSTGAQGEHKTLLNYRL